MNEDSLAFYVCPICGWINAHVFGKRACGFCLSDVMISEDINVELEY